jgi:hypothetical protein
MPISIQRELITREIASDLLSRNVSNRPMSQNWARELAADMRAGRWQQTHQGIAIADDGTLVDGQHRLRAIELSGIPQEMLVARGLPRSTFAAVDQGRRRTPGQLVAMIGLRREPTRIASMARTILLCAYDQTIPSNPEVLEFVSEYGTQLESYLPIARKHGPAVAAAFAYAELRGWRDVPDAARRLVELDFRGEGDPMRALARRGESFSQLGGGRKGLRTKFEITLNALLAVEQGRELKTARPASPVYADLPGAAPRLPTVAPPGESPVEPPEIREGGET